MNNVREYQSYNSRKYDFFNKLIVDDMVITKDNDNLPRLRRKKSVTEELITGRDNNVRWAVVRVIDNKEKIITLRRDYKCLKPCEKYAKNITEDNLKRTVAVDADIFRKSMV